MKMFAFIQFLVVMLKCVANEPLAELVRWILVAFFRYRVRLHVGANFRLGFKKFSLQGFFTSYPYHRRLMFRPSNLCAGSTDKHCEV